MEERAETSARRKSQLEAVKAKQDGIEALYNKLSAYAKIEEMEHQSQALILRRRELHQEIDEKSSSCKEMWNFYTQQRELMESFQHKEAIFWEEEEAKLQNLQEEVEKLEWEVADLSRLTERASSDQAEIRALEKENHELTNCYESLQREERTLESSIAAVSAQLRQAERRQEEEKSHLHQMIERRKKEVEALQRENEKVEEAVMRATGQKNAKRRDLDQLEQALAKLRSTSSFRGPV